MGSRGFLTIAGAASALVLWVACGSSAQTQGSAPAAPAAPVAPLPLLPAHALMGGSGLSWTAPEGWQIETPSSSMRRAQYRIPASPGDPEDAECGVFYFGVGQGGDVQGNVERWASQFKGPEGAEAVPKVTEVRVGGLAVTEVELKGTYTPSQMGSPLESGGPKPGYMLLGAIVPGSGANWFFKCTGPEKTMEANRQRFGLMIASVYTTG